MCSRAGGAQIGTRQDSAYRERPSLSRASYISGESTADVTASHDRHDQQNATASQSHNKSAQVRAFARDYHPSTGVQRIRA